LIHPADLERRQIDDELTECASFEHAAIHAQAFLEASLMGGIETSPVPPTPALPDTTLCGDRVAASISLRFHARL
jgi:hypothetical protein